MFIYIHVHLNMNVHIHVNMYACVCAYMRSTTSVAGAEYPIFYISIHITHALHRPCSACVIEYPIQGGEDA